MSRTRVVLGLSGGVDSSVAALLLLEQGYDVHAVFMKNWEDRFEPGYCAAGDDLEDARDVCQNLGIPLHTVNFTREYRERVFEYFLREHRAARTPNPDILCNTEIKFRAFLDHARRLGADHIATGHYARLDGCGPYRRLLKGRDPGKDQSYFLHGLTPSQLADVLFPLGDLHKSRVRELADRAGLITCDKKDSTGICFIGERDFRAFLGQYLPSRPGPMRTPEGETVGQHQGLAFYTIGQRQGLGIGGRAGDSGQPWYVAGKHMADNALIVVQGSRHPSLYHRRLRAGPVHWITGPPPPDAPLGAKTRYRQGDQPCTIETFTAEGCTVVFDSPQRAITPGQSVVFYHDQVCLGGAVIEAALD